MRGKWILCPILGGMLFGQPGDPSPKFEVADVHASAHVMTPGVVGPYFSSGRYELRRATMLDLIRQAYGFDSDKIMGGPDWLEMDRFDVVAKPPDGSTPESRKLMLQALLTERFGLAVHKDSSPMPAWALTAGKHAGLKEADPAGEPGCKSPQAGDGPIQFRANSTAGDGPMIMAPSVNYTCRKMTMAAFAETLSTMRFAPGVLQGRPVTDRTGLPGAWDFTLAYSPQIRGPIGVSMEVTSLSDAVEKQLGLKLEAIKLPMPVLMVDKANRKPTENSPGVAQKLPVAPVEFEVAEIKPPAQSSDNTGMILIARAGGRIFRGDTEVKNGRVTLKNYSIKDLISMAWEIDFDDGLAGLPKWADTERFDIIAKMPGPAPSSESRFETDMILPMLRTLLTDRFKIASHIEERQVSGYTLTAAKPKMAKADPANRSKCQNGPGPDGKDPRVSNPALSRLLYCQNVTMAQFADLLPSLAGGYIHTPVLDATGIEGAFDFTLSFSPAGMGNGGAMTIIRGGDGGGGAPGGASDPGGGLSLLDALNKQLGLKLEAQKRNMPVLVIDHVEQKPSDN